jgi:hypothetical protein
VTYGDVSSCLKSNNVHWSYVRIQQLRVIDMLISASVYPLPLYSDMPMKICEDQGVTGSMHSSPSNDNRLLSTCWSLLVR